MSAELPEPLDVMAVGAHPDDVEIAVGGILASLVQQGYRVGICDLTDGEPTPGSAGPEVRMAEAAEAARILGVQLRITLDLPNRRLFDSYESRVALAKVFRRHRPRLVLGIHGKTPGASPDHWQAMQITDAAVFYARLTKWDREFDNLVVHPVHRQLYYPLGLGALDVPLERGFVVDISNSLDRKLEAIRAYRSQFPPAKDRVFRLVEGQAKLYGRCGRLPGRRSADPGGSSRRARSDEDNVRLRVVGYQIPNIKHPRPPQCCRCNSPSPPVPSDSRCGRASTRRRRPARPGCCSMRAPSSR